MHITYTIKEGLANDRLIAVCQGLELTFHILINYLHAVSRTQQGKQKEPSLKFSHSVSHFPNSGGTAC